MGALGTALGSSPEASASGQATSQGTRQLAAALVDGLTVTVNLCTGLTRVELGRLARGTMAAADVGETSRVPVELQPGAVMIIGPSHADAGMSLEAEATRGSARLSLVCVEQAELVASEVLAGRPPPKVSVLGSVDVRTKAKLQIKPTSCPVDVLVTPLGDAPARFTWTRPRSEIARIDRRRDNPLCEQAVAGAPMPTGSLVPFAPKGVGTLVLLVGAVRRYSGRAGVRAHRRARATVVIAIAGVLQLATYATRVRSVRAAIHAVGVPTAVALSATLAFRGLSFWLPMLPGLVASRHVSRRRPARPASAPPPAPS